MKIYLAGLPGSSLTGESKLLDKDLLKHRLFAFHYVSTDIFTTRIWNFYADISRRDSWKLKAGGRTLAEITSP